MERIRSQDDYPWEATKVPAPPPPHGSLSCVLQLADLNHWLLRLWRLPFAPPLATLWFVASAYSTSYCLGVGASIGAGVFVVIGTVARDAGPGVTISFLLAGASCVLNALCYAELASRFPAVLLGELTCTRIQLSTRSPLFSFSCSSCLIIILGRLVSLVAWQELFGGFLSLNILAPILLALLTLVLCQGVRESSAVNSVMTATNVCLLSFFLPKQANWSPFAPNGFKAVLTGATVVFFAYVGFDAVANSAEESKNPQCDLPVGIMGSLMVCISLYIGVCLVHTGMVPFSLLSEDAPLAEAFSSNVQVISGTRKGWSIALILF